MHIPFARQWKTITVEAFLSDKADPLTLAHGQLKQGCVVRSTLVTTRLKIRAPLAFSLYRSSNFWFFRLFWNVWSLCYQYFVFCFLVFYFILFFFCLFWHSLFLFFFVCLRSFLYFTECVCLACNIHYDDIFISITFFAFVLYYCRSISGIRYQVADTAHTCSISITACSQDWVR